jgi:hypothetical protein
MAKRPLSITVISWILIADGSIAILTSLKPLSNPIAAQEIAEHRFLFLLILATRIYGILSAMLMLYGFNCARWLLVGWIGYHLILSGLDSFLQLFVLSLLFATILYFLFRPSAGKYFEARGRRRRVRIQRVQM